jgi:uptake hydrogenase large subunit
MPGVAIRLHWQLSTDTSPPHSMSDPAGRLNIQLRRTPHGIDCRIRSTRPVTASTMLVGRTATEVAVLLPMLFSICAQAQACACVTALEQASGAIPDPRRWMLRQRAVGIETIREHLWRILLDWPRLLCEPADHSTMADVLSLMKALVAALDPVGDLFRPSGQWFAPDPAFAAPLLTDLAARLAGCVFGIQPERWLEEVCDHDAFAAWMQTTETSAARLMRKLVAAEEAALCPVSIAALPPLEDTALLARMEGQEGLAFLARPTWDGIARETTPFTRQADQPLLQELTSAFGPGLLSRLAAHLLEVATLLAEIREGFAIGAFAPTQTSRLRSGVGFGRAQAARGLLVHLVELERDRILDYRILAPTEWNFHPQGVVVEALSAMPPTADALLLRRADLLIMATDPCIAYDLTIEPNNQSA